MLVFGGILELSHLERLFGAAVSPELPQTLHYNWATKVQWLPDGSAAFTAYSEYESIVLPGKVYGLLLEFNGRRTVEEVRQRLREHRQTDISEELLLALHQHRILLPS